ncbi:MAG: hypothetical protein E7376_03530 [Clostridiales bacterium]|nr:hypothetical protein [Clostridiales bacterium]
MKNKFKWLINIFTLVLCVCALAIGVYAAKTAMLNLGGTLGFTMHSCLVEVSGTISPVAVKDSNGSYKKETITLDRAIMGSESSDSVTTTNMDLGSLEFYKGYDMVFDFEFKNMSGCATLAEFSIEFQNDAVTIVNDGVYDILPTTKVISPNGIVNLCFALHLEDETQILNGFNFTITADFEEFVVQEDVNGYNYVTMGTEDGSKTGTAIKWYPFAKQQDGSLVAFDATQDLTAGEYCFISEYVLDLSTQYANSSITIDESKSSTNYGLDFTDLPIGQLLNGTGDNSIFTKYGMSNSKLYNVITPQTLNGYKYRIRNCFSEPYTVYYSGTTNPATNQSFVLLNYGDYNLLADVGSNSPLKKDAKLITDKSSTKSWWLQSSFSYLDYHSTDGVSGSYYSGTSTVYYGGSANTNLTDLASSYYIRPCFQLTIN